MKDKEKRNNWWSFSEPGAKLFGKDESGRNVFYPWGTPGEAFYVSEKQLIHILLFFFFLLILFGICILERELYKLQNVFNPNVWEATISLIYISLPVIYVAGMHLIRKGKTLYLLSEQERPPKRGMYILLFSIVSFQVAALATAPTHLFVPLVILSTACIVSFFKSLMGLRNSRGYYFAEKE